MDPAVGEARPKDTAPRCNPRFLWKRASRPMSGIYDRHSSWWPAHPRSRFSGAPAFFMQVLLGIIGLALITLTAFQLNMPKLPPPSSVGPETISSYTKE